MHVKSAYTLKNGQEENRTPMTARPPHFECGASTNFATRPWVQLYYSILYLLNLQQEKRKIFAWLNFAKFQYLWNLQNI